MDLSDRLQVIADYVPKNSIVADIGTDHGYLPIYLIENNISKKVIAADISKNSLEKAIFNIEKNNYKNKIDARLGNGLEVIKQFEVDTVVISGMGGILIKDILEANKEKTSSISNFILQPNIATDELRKYLSSNKFEILDEKLVKDGNKYYEVLFVREGLTYEENGFYQIGQKLIDNRDPLLEEFINYKMSLNNNIIDTLKANEGEKSRERYDYLLDENKKYQEVLNKIEG